MSFPGYPAYKPSGVEWLGEVPEHWEVLPLKRRSRLLTEKTECRDNPIALENIEGWTGRLVETDSEFLGEGVAFEPGDILFGKLRPYLAKVYLAAKGGQAVGDFHVIHPFDSLHPRFLQLFLLTKEMIDLVNGSTFGAKMPRASWDFLASLHLSIPPLDDQLAIATFLNHETAKFDALIAEQQRLIELLQEKRQAVISHAVTKGLNPDTPMKDSGVEWLGEVPEHWDVAAVGHKYSVQLGKMLDSAQQTGDHSKPYLRVADVQWDSINTNDLPEMDFPPHSQERYLLKAGDLLVNEGGSYVGRAAIWEEAIEECYYQKALHRLRASQEVRDSTHFMYWLMEYATKTGVFIAGGNQTTIDHLTAEQLRKYRFGFPSLEEQFQIADYVRLATGKLLNLTKDAENLVKILQERRSALISAAVTGQIDVRGYAPEAAVA
jgi:type I restriction enzyme S subunit